MRPRKRIWIDAVDQQPYEEFSFFVNIWGYATAETLTEKVYAALLVHPSVLQLERLLLQLAEFDQSVPLVVYCGTPAACAEALTMGATHAACTPTDLREKLKLATARKPGPRGRYVWKEFTPHVQLLERA